MNAGAERHPRIHRDAETALGRRVVAPFRHQKETPSHFHGLQQIARGLYPIAHFFLALAGARKELQQCGAIHIVFEEGPDCLRTQFHHAGRALLP